MRIFLPTLLFILLTGACTAPRPTVTNEPAPMIAATRSTFDVQGHRGARGLQPENTLPAFETALDLGVTTLELDLHYTADGQVVVWHDPQISADKCRLSPTATPPLPPDPDRDPAPLIRQLTMAQLKAYICDRNPDRDRFPLQQATATELAGANYTLATLAELFDFVANYAESDLKNQRQRSGAEQVLFNLETKRKINNPAAIGDGFDGQHAGPFEEAIVALILATDLIDRTIIQSFDHRSLWAVGRLEPRIRLAALTSRQFELENYAESGAVIWSPGYQDLSAQLVEQAHALGLQVIPWTVNEPADMQHLIDLDVDGIITDRPDLLLEAE